MKIVSWNVNGLRSVIKKGFIEFVKKEAPDILCLQEIKAHPEQVDKILEDYEHHIWNPAEKKGYSGTVIFSKIKPLSIKLGKELLNDNEGRVIVAEFEKFFLVNVYTPNSQRGLLRLNHRLEWDKNFLKVLKNLESKKPVVFCGDLNVAHKEIDIARPKDNSKNAGFTMEERNSFDNYINSGFVDSFRLFNLEGNNYTWWSPMHNAREKNIGWRIDYFCTSNSFKKEVKSSNILREIKGSDHCPIKLEIN